MVNNRYKPNHVAADAVLGKSNMAADENFNTWSDKEIILFLHVVMDYKAAKARDEYRKQYQFAATCTA